MTRATPSGQLRALRPIKLRVAGAGFTALRRRHNALDYTTSDNRREALTLLEDSAAHKNGYFMLRTYKTKLIS